MKKYLGTLMIIAPVAFLSFGLVKYLNNGNMNIVAILAAIVVGLAYVLTALWLYDSDD